jgi:hypothetical protein
MRTRVTASLIMLLSVTVTSAACGGATRTPPPATPSSASVAAPADACGVLSVSDVATATGLDARAGVLDATVDAPACVWEVGAAGSGQQVELRLYTGRLYLYRDAQPEDSVRIALPQTAGYWDTREEYLAVKRGDQAFHLLVQTTQPVAQRQQIATTLATLALAHLPAD